MISNNFWYSAKIGFLFFIVLFLYGSCKKENLPIVDSLKGTTVRYTVLVVLAGNSSFKSSDLIDGTIVSVVMNDSIYNSVTDENGLATFNNLAAGVTAVHIRHSNYTTANLIVDLTARIDTGYDTENLRNAATMVVLFPLSGSGTATISGRIFADLDITSPGLEIAPPGLQVSSIIEPGQLINYVNHSGDGEILSLFYESTVKQEVTNTGGDYSISVPATGSGLKIVVKANDFEYNQVTGVAMWQRKVYRSDSDTIVAVSGMSYYNDIDYN